MCFHREFTRPLLMQITDQGAAFVELLANRAEVDHTLAGHLVAALADLRKAFPDLDVQGVPQPSIPKE